MNKPLAGNGDNAKPRSKPGANPPAQECQDSFSRSENDADSVIGVKAQAKIHSRDGGVFVPQTGWKDSERPTGKTIGMVR